MSDLRERSGGNPRAYRNHTADLWVGVVVLVAAAAAVTLFGG